VTVSGDPVHLRDDKSPLPQPEQGQVCAISAIGGDGIGTDINGGILFEQRPMDVADRLDGGDSMTDHLCITGDNPFVGSVSSIVRD
jgi:hypothetical protein